MSIIPPIETKVDPSTVFLLKGEVRGGGYSWSATRGDLSAPGVLHEAADGMLNQTLLVIKPGYLSQAQEHTFLLQGTGGATGLYSQVTFFSYLHPKP